MKYYKRLRICAYSAMNLEILYEYSLENVLLIYIFCMKSYT